MAGWGRPPLLCVAGLIAVSCLVLLLPSATLGAATNDSDYRLAGVVLVGKDHLGFLELPQGGQVLVRKGSVVNGGRVIAFTDKVLQIQFPDRLLELTLEGSGRPPSVEPRSVVTDAQDSPGGGAYFRNVSVDSLDRALAAKSTAKTASTTAPTETSVVLARRFEPLFQLPPGSRVKQVNEVPVRSVDSAIKMVETTLKNYGVARLNIETNAGEARVYLSPAPPPRSP